jgi:hypothetical protein
MLGAAVVLVVAMTLGVHRPAGAASVRPTYHGGAVETQPQIYIDFWGTWTHDPLGQRGYDTSFVSSINGSSWLKTLGQYRVGWRHTSYKGSWSDPNLSHRPGPNPSQSAAQAEATRAAQHFGVRSNANVLIILALPIGGTCNPYHSWDAAQGVPFATSPYNDDPGCAGGAQTVSHEIAEAMTDPEPFTGWSPEVADPCDGRAANVRMPNGETFYVQQLFSDSANKCVLTS